MRTLGLTVVCVVLLAASGSAAMARGDPASRPPVPSVGCGSSQVEAGPLTGRMGVGSVGRSWLVHVPPAHDGQTPLPLVIQLHGLTVSPSAMVQTTAFGELGKTEGIVVATPQGRGGTTHWLFESGASEPDLSPANPDVAFIDGLLDRLAADLCLDLARVYATGFSQGGEFAGALACALEHRIAATASVAGLLDFGEACAPSRPVPHLAFHGTADPFVLFESGQYPKADEVVIDGVRWSEWPVMSWPGMSVPVTDNVAAAAERNGCAAETRTEPLADGVEALSWSCPAGSEVELVVIDGGGHAWPGSALHRGYEPILGPVTMDIDATAMMWEFFEQHPMPE